VHWSVFLFRFVIYFWHLILITIRDPNMDLKVSLSCFSTIEQIGKKSRIRIPIHILYPDLFPEYRFCFLSGSGSWARSGPYLVFQTYTKLDCGPHLYFETRSVHEIYILFNFCTLKYGSEHTILENSLI